MKYTALLARNVVEYADVQFEAKNDKEALAKALKMVEEGEGHWKVGGDTEEQGRVVTLETARGRLVDEDIYLEDVCVKG